MFKKAERTQVKLKLAITGPSGSGKTYSALRLASGLGKKIALIDTENRSAALYSDRFNFDVLELGPPFTVQKYTKGITDAHKAGYEILIIDSITHAWAGEGGLLQKKEALDQRGRQNHFTNWGVITKEHEQFKSWILQSDIHIICTMRSKQDYILEQNEKGKQAPKKVGYAPIQRDGMEYEFTTVFDVAMDHNAQASKDRTELFTDKIFQISEETGTELMKWLSTGKPAPPLDTPSQSEDKRGPDVSTKPTSSIVSRVKRMEHAVEKGQWAADDVKAYRTDILGVRSISELSDGVFDELIRAVETTNPNQHYSEQKLKKKKPQPDQQTDFSTSTTNL